MARIEFDRIRKTWGDVVAVDALTLTIDDGEFVSVWVAVFCDMSHWAPSLNPMSPLTTVSRVPAALASRNAVRASALASASASRITKRLSIGIN